MSTVSARGPDRPRKHPAVVLSVPEDPISDRPSSVAMITARISRWFEALAAADEDTEILRSESRALAREALPFSRQEPLWLTPMGNRQRIAVEREPSGRGTS